MTLKRYGTKRLYVSDMQLLRSTLDQFKLYMDEILPNISQHLDKESVSVSLFATSWFHTMFSREGQMDFVMRIWDIFYNEGISIIFRVALAILKESKDEILSCSLEGLMDYLKICVRQITDIDLILTAALTKIPKVKLITDMYDEAELLELRSNKVRSLYTKEPFYLVDPVTLGDEYDEDFKQELMNLNSSTKFSNNDVSPKLISIKTGFNIMTNRLSDPHPEDDEIPPPPPPLSTKPKLSLDNDGEVITRRTHTPSKRKLSKRKTDYNYTKEQINKNNKPFGIPKEC